MTESVLREIVHRAVTDGTFRCQLERDPSAALAGFALTAGERAAIASRDPRQLTALGVDQRMSKAFGMGVLGDVSKAVIADDVTVGGAAFIDDGAAAAGTTVIVGDPLTADPATESMSAFGRHLWMVEQDLDAGSSLEAPADPQIEGTQVPDLDQDY